jgi:hypothetical protein
MDAAPPNPLISRFFTPFHANQNNFPARFLFLVFLQTVIKAALYRTYSFCTAKLNIFCTARISPKTPVIPHIPLNSTSPAFRRPTQIVDFTFFTFFTFRFGVSHRDFFSVSVRILSPLSVFRPLRTLCNSSLHSTPQQLAAPRPFCSNQIRFTSTPGSHTMEAVHGPVAQSAASGQGRPE